MKETKLLSQVIPITKPKIFLRQLRFGLKNCFIIGTEVSNYLVKSQSKSNNTYNQYQIIQMFVRARVAQSVR